MSIPPRKSPPKSGHPATVPTYASKLAAAGNWPNNPPGKQQGQQKRAVLGADGKPKPSPPRPSDLDANAPGVDSTAGRSLAMKHFGNKEKETPIPTVHARAPMARADAPVIAPVPSTVSPQQPRTAPIQQQNLRTTRTPHVMQTDCPAGYFRIGLPSNCVPYDFDTVFVRPFSVTDLASLASAVKEGTFTRLVDALAPTIVQDIRVLTEQDMRFLMYWWRLNSYSKSPYNISWTSMYGNLNTLTVKTTDMKPILLKMTREEYAKYKALGIRFPTVRDVEAIDNESGPTAGDDFLLRRAQYIYLTPEESVNENGEPLQGSEWFNKRIEKLKAMTDLSILENIREFAEQIEHGVEESFIARDEKFDPAKSITYLNDQADVLVRLAESENLDADPERAGRYIDRSKFLMDEADAIQQMLDNPQDATKKYTPKPEKVFISISSLDFFPAI